mmetsp:Transcript_2811/g.11076  ORF Transcript_2811/g.11076 Transcript_2811/m.11076 type:complete len:201 (-) Transcript_2811:36-638(-)
MARRPCLISASRYCANFERSVQKPKGSKPASPTTLAANFRYPGSGTKGSALGNSRWRTSSYRWPRLSTSSESKSGLYASLRTCPLRSSAMTPSSSRIRSSAETLAFVGCESMRLDRRDQRVLVLPGLQSKVTPPKVINPDSIMELLLLSAPVLMSSRHGEAPTSGPTSATAAESHELLAVVLPAPSCGNNGEGVKARIAP